MPASLGRRVRVLVAAGAIASACGPARLPAPELVEQTTAALSEVPYPPPPARVETVPTRPKANAVWIDGEWTWQARRYAWKPGRWVVPPANARFSPWTTVRDARGTLYLAPGVWRDERGAEIAEPPALALGVPGAGPIITPEGDRLPPGPVLTMDAGAPPPAAPDTSALELDVDAEIVDAEIVDAGAVDTDAATMGGARP